MCAAFCNTTHARADNIYDALHLRVVVPLYEAHGAFLFDLSAFGCRGTVRGIFDDSASMRSRSSLMEYEYGQASNWAMSGNTATSLRSGRSRIICANFSLVPAAFCRLVVVGDGAVAAAVVVVVVAAIGVVGADRAFRVGVIGNWPCEKDRRSAGAMVRSLYGGQSTKQAAGDDE
jgi:hypothetical protein